MLWIGIRVEKYGTSKKHLKRLGFVEIARGHNPSGFDMVRPCGETADFKMLEPLAKRGLRCVAIQITDAQWGFSAPLTQTQWETRAIIGLRASGGSFEQVRPKQKKVSAN